MKKVILLGVGIAVLCAAFFLWFFWDKKIPKIGVSMGVGPAARWAREKVYMEERAKELGVDIEVRLNTTDKPKTQKEDCIELIDSGVDVLIITPRNVNEVGEILAYAKKKKVPIIAYARLIIKDKFDLFVGYDSWRIGQRLGQYLTEMVYKGDYIILRGDQNDFNALLLYDGAMDSINKIKNNINVIIDTSIHKWSPDEAYEIVKKAVAANDNHVDAILAPNDKIAEASRRAIDELGVKSQVIITGMDAELEAVKRIVDGKQSCTIYMDLKELAETAVNEACNIAKGIPINLNGDFDNKSGSLIPANLITGQLVTKENIKRILIDNGYFKSEDIYGELTN